MELYLILYVTIASGFVPVPLVAQPNITSFGRACANEQITVYCVGEGAVEWTSDLAIGQTSISFRVGVDARGETRTRGNATGELVSVNVTTNTINSSLAYNVSDGVIICTDGSGRSSSYVHPIYQRPGLLFPSFDDLGDRYVILSWDKPMNSEEYVFRNYIITIRSNSDTPQTTTIKDEDTTFVNGAFDRRTNYSFALVTTSSCEQSESVPFRISPVSPDPTPGLTPGLTPGSIAAIVIAIVMSAVILILILILVCRYRPVRNKIHALFSAYSLPLDEPPLSVHSLPLVDLTQENMESSQHLRREDFKNDEDYGECIKLHLRPNMIVRALRDYESVVKGDIGVCKQANSEMPLAQFKWIKAGGVEVKTYSVYWYMVEILSDDEDETLGNEEKSEASKKVSAESSLLMTDRSDQSLESIERLEMEKEYYKRKMEENYQREICQREYIIERYEEKLKEKECTIQRLQGKEQDIVYADPEGMKSTEQDNKVNSPQVYLRREDFNNDQNYGNYIELVLRPNMLVRALCDYDESVIEGDIGVFKQSNNEIPPAQFKWIRAGKLEMKSVEWHMVEIFNDDEDENHEESKVSQQVPAEGMKSTKQDNKDHSWKKKYAFFSRYREARSKLLKEEHESLESLLPKTEGD